MTVPNLNTRQSWNGNGSTKSFPFSNISYYADADFTVIYRNVSGVEITLVKNTDYTITPSGSSLPYSAGTLDLIGAWIDYPPAAGTKIVLVRSVPYTQAIDLVTGGDMPADTMEEGYDRATMLVQQLKEMVGRACLLSASSAYSSLVMPDPQAGGYFLAWKSDLSGLQNVFISSYLPAGSLPLGTLTSGYLTKVVSGVLQSSSFYESLPYRGIGTNAPETSFHIEADGSYNQVMVRTYYPASSPSPSLIFSASRGTKGTPSAVAAWDCLGAIITRSRGATTFSGDRAGIFLWATQTWTDAAQGTCITFATTANSTTTNTERMRINNDGYVGIGTTTPSQPLHISNDNYSSTVLISVHGSSIPYTPIFACRSSRGSAASPSATQSGDVIGSLRCRGHDGSAWTASRAVIDMFAAENMGSSAHGTYMSFQTTAIGTTSLSERMRINSDGKVGIGVSSFTSNGGKLEVLDGITFPATQSACSNVNTLDDYEEGTFTPTLTPATSGSITLTTALGAYVKIGKVVHLNIVLRVNTVSSPVGYLSLGGFPFTCNSTYYGAVALLVAGMTSSWVTSFCGYIYPNATSANIYRFNAGNIVLDSANYTQANADLLFTITYTTN